MADPSLDDQLKLAQIDKMRAEADKLRNDSVVANTSAKNGVASEAIKILAGVVIGIGGFLAASTQFEVAELRAGYANEKLKVAEAAALSASEAALAAVKRKEEAERLIAEYKEALEKQAVATPLAKGEAQPRLVYIQFRGAITRVRVNSLRAFLSKNGFNAPGAERVPGEYGSLVKYFTDSDAAAATSLKDAVEKQLKQQGCDGTLRLVKPENPSGKASPLEVWIHSDCK